MLCTLHNKNSGRAALLCRCFCLKVDNKKGSVGEGLRSGGPSQRGSGGTGHTTRCFLYDNELKTIGRKVLKDNKQGEWLMVRKY